MRLPRPTSTRWLAAALLCAVASAAARPAPAPTDPIEAAPPSEGLTAIRLHVEAGDTDRARATARAIAEDPARTRADRDRARFALGVLAPLAWWYEAEAAAQLDEPAAAIRLCEELRSRWPDGAHATDCLRVIALAHAARGHAAAARTAALAYDDEHPYGKITENVELLLVQWDADHAPARAIPRLRALAVAHETPLGGRLAESLLDALRARGHADAVVPDDTASLQRRALSLRETRRADLAWEVYEEIARRGATDPSAAAWAAAQADAFGWRARQWSFLLARYDARYRASPSAAAAWSAVKAGQRGGDRAAIRRWGRVLLEKHPGAPELRAHAEEVGRSLLLAGDYPTAIQAFDLAIARGGSTAKRAKTAAGIAAYLAGDRADARARLTEAAATGDRAARYWLGRTLRDAGADPRPVWGPLVAQDADDWYGRLARRGDAPAVARNGRWPREPTLPADFAPVDAVTADPLRLPGFAFPGGGPTLAPTETVLRVSEAAPPPSYPRAGFGAPDAGRASLRQGAALAGEAWPELAQVAELADLGLYDLSGPLISTVYAERTKALVRSGPRRTALKAWAPSPEQWRDIFLFARDHHHVARAAYGWAVRVPPADARAALQLAFPLAHDRAVWAASYARDVDPFLVLGLMRQESTYNAIARSRVGARGAMQIMPRTGHLLADLAHDTDFTAGDLEDPTVSVQYGITYLDLLLTRFDGAFPLAVASYNAGPFNASAWLAGVGPGVPTEVWVEHIPFRETREYVQKVTAYYETYLALYAPDHHGVVLPATPTGDHPEIVDF